MWDQLSQLLPGFGWTWVLVYLRVQALMLVLPGIGERVIPVRVRAAAAIAVTPMLAGLAPPALPPSDTLTTLGQAAGETLIGLAAGMGLRLLALSLDIATSAIAATASLSQLVGGQNEAAPHPIGNMIHLAGLAVLMVLGLPILLVQLMADSLALWPPGGWPDADGLAAEAIRLVARSFWIAMLLAAPFTLGGFMFQALSGVINRVMPALPVIFIGSPAAIMLALAALALLAPVLIGLWADAILGHVLPGAP
ncbi:flagellar biosynthesis protein FliR [Paracoccus haematequi]|uniref:Flagellar biosynthesis protein FliR n=1 Tax=Paracoccus haematequi TaxID=2491866 RepID=A0A447IKK0_9RHOB|nr:flagellar biosynthetic protein FliR [Paracoccus haematequi]VDS08052.1 flagellar biosynthesis protein FliR [Paracoccus haematequi]